MNPVLQQVLGEARALSGPGGLGFTDPESRADIDPVGVVTGQPRSPEEQEEVHIGKEILHYTHLLPPLARRDTTIQNIERLANRLIQMHQRS